MNPILSGMIHKTPDPLMNGSTALPIIVILAGGLSQRMGRNKAALKLADVTLLEHVRQTARQTGWPVRVIRRDVRRGCGPLGGTLTAFRRHRADSILFLACDMPFLTPQFLKRIHRLSHVSHRPVFTRLGGLDGFPFVLRRCDLGVVTRQVKGGDLSLQSLAAALDAKSIVPNRAASSQFVNLNTPGDWNRCQANRTPG